MLSTLQPFIPRSVQDVPLPGAGQEASSASHGLDKVTFYGQ